VSIVELKRAVKDLSTEDRLELVEHIRQSFRVDDPQWQIEVEQRLNACLQGQGHSMEELLVLHDRLCAGGQ
jgi:hypothetical protein